MEKGLRKSAFRDREADILSFLDRPPHLPNLIFGKAGVAF